MTSSEDTPTTPDLAADETVADETSTDETGTDAPEREATPLEASILKGQTGEGDMNEVIGQFVNALIVVPTATEVTDDLNALEPVLFDREGMPMLAVFSHIDRVPEQVAQVAGYAVQMPAAELVQAIPEGTGLVVNPGHTAGFEMLAEGVQQLAHDVRGMLEAMEQGQAAAGAGGSGEPAAPKKVDPSGIPNF
ncbi:type III secretion system (T3SS) SseB-like protein [Frondihabitans sp. PhB188]|uniref:SseB family protein n=1 Tax=Frondihabitans sp. PhB188 TaxID=2485200 RepID=UPI000F469819|nr:SseB family protein [Frondihabitans sp. PhB188]ROQ38469.1 type III secretion system (T3SS) SseB-like protein [Frondihabitans sp. PhB188]